MDEYPRRVVLQSDNLTKLLTQINDLVLSGREMSQEIEEKEAVMADIDKQIQEIESKVDVKDLDERIKSVVERVNTVKAEQQEIEKEIYARCKALVPSELVEKYENAKKSKESLEKDRNKVALKVQKFKDRSIPLARKLMKPHLQDEFDDYEGVVLENGELIGTIFNHLLDWKEKWREKLREKYMK